MNSPGLKEEQRQGLLFILIAILVFGSMWGLSEVALGNGLRTVGFPYLSGLLTGIGMGVMGMALAVSRKWLLPVGIGVVAALATLMVVPITHVSVMCKANSCLALGLESGSLSLAALLIGGKTIKSVYGRMAMGGGAALLASAAFYFIGTHVAPCNYLLSFATPGSFIVTEGLVWAAFSAILLPLGYTAGEWLSVRSFPVLRERNLAYYASSAFVVALCWAVSASVIAAGSLAMLIVVTGNIGIGKSTVCRRVVDSVQDAGYPCGGIITTKATDGSILIEDVRTGRHMTLAGAGGMFGGPQVGKYSFNPAGLDFGIAAITQGLGLPLLVIDEIGPLELAGEGFAGTVKMVNEEEAGNQMLVIRRELLASFLPLFERTALVFETSVGNRDRLPQQIGQIITEYSLCPV